MALHWRPVGPEPEMTYWQRRALVLLAVLLPLVLLVWLLGGDDDADRVAQRSARPAASPTAVPTPTPALSSSPTASPSPSAAAPCAPGSLVLRAGATEASYALGSKPKLELSIGVTGAPCTIDLGQAAVELLVFSGADRIWSSDDCAPGGAPRPTTLEPGKPDISRVTWPGTRSLPGCKGTRAAAQPGTYRVAARVGDQRLEGEPFLLRG